jgi:hypothetical protein
VALFKLIAGPNLAGVSRGEALSDLGRVLGENVVNGLMGLTLGGDLAPRGGLYSRAVELQALRPSRYDIKNTTTAIVRAVDSNGNIVDLVAHSSGRLSPEQVAATLRTGELPVPFLNAPGLHAEERALLYAQFNNLTPLEVAASRPICPRCASQAVAAGAIPVGPLKNPWLLP